MRRKIKEIMNKEEGFTLVELLAVIVIIGIIVAIAVPAIGNVINTADEGATTAEEELVVDAARMYFTLEKKGQFEKEKKSMDVSVEDLVNAGYLEAGGRLKGTVKIEKETATSNKITYTPSLTKATDPAG